MTEAATKAQEAPQTTQEAAGQPASSNTQPGPAQQAPATNGAGQANDAGSLPQWAQAELAELRKEAAGHRKAKQAADQAAQQAEEARLASERQWEQLAEQRATKISALEQTAAAYDALSQEISASLDAEIAAWPEDVRTLRPADAQPAALMAWAKAARPLAAKLTNTQPAAPGQAPAPRPAGQASGDQRRTAQQALQRTQSTF